MMEGTEKSNAEEKRNEEERDGATELESPIEEKVFQGFMLVAVVWMFLAPRLASDTDFCRKPILHMAELPFFERAIYHGFIKSAEICSFEWMLIEYTFFVVTGFIYFGAPIPPVWFARARAKGFPDPKFGDFCFYLIGCSLICYGLIYLIALLPVDGDLSFVRKLLFLSERTLCAGSLILGFGLFPTYWLLFKRRRE
ncbi:hypothetical protein [Methylocystis sp.]|uniref:hypothetical protein n=1 Tax=Methylocystis sp. TaxID=1911079 RepID=UPI003DA2D116